MRVTLECTQEEFTAVLPLIAPYLVGPIQTSVAPVTLAAAQGLKEEVVMDFLQRRPLTKIQRGVLSSLQAAGESGSTPADMAQEVGCAVDDVRGAMRSFGKRAAHTEGWPDGMKPFKQRWEGQNYRYRLRPEFRTVFDSGAVTL